MMEETGSQGSGLLNVAGVSKSFGGLWAVKDVDLAVRANSRCAVIGPNGAGKTTLFNLITRKLRPEKGTVHFNGKRVDHLRPSQIARLGLVRTFQVTSVFSELTTLVNIQIAFFASGGSPLEIFRSASRAYHDQALGLLEEMGLQEKSRMPVSDLSYGDRHRLELAMVLARNPKLLVLDEPAAGLGDRERYQMKDLLVEICSRRELSLLFSDHDMDVVFTVADWVVVMNQGRVLAQGTPDAIRNNDDVRHIYLGTISA